MPEEKAQLAYALWRKQTIAERKGSASLRFALIAGPLVLGGILNRLEVDGIWYFLVALPLALGALLAMVDHSSADRVPSWHDLQREYEYEVWKIQEEAKARKR